MPKRSPTHDLTGARFELTADGRRRNCLLVVLVVLILAVLGGAAVRYFETRLEPIARLAEFEAANERLRADADAARMELELERATSAELKRQVADLNERVSQLNRQLGFFNSQANGSK